MGALVRYPGRMTAPRAGSAALPLTASRLAVAVGLVALIFGVGMASDAVFAALTRGWQSVFEAVGLGRFLVRLQQDTSTQVTTRSLPAMVTYSLLYVAGCLLLVHVLLRSARRTWWAGQLYLGLLGLCALLLVVAKVGGNITWAYKLGRRIIDFVVSPLPVMLLVPLLWPGWGRAREVPTVDNE